MPRLKLYPEDLPGVPVQDIWADIRTMHNLSSERLGYPTQKPLALLERILRASSNEGDVVLDPFCGCGTSIAAAEGLCRRWVGIDITHLAITVMKRRLQDAFGAELAPYVVVGAPRDVHGAEALAQENPYQFEWWALDLVEARPAQDKRKGADRGVDGYVNFFDDESGQAKKIVVQVKSGHVSAPQVRDLRGVLERERAAIGAFITLQEPTRPMREEALAAGFYEPRRYPGRRYPKLQILTVAELLAGKQVEYPRVAPEITFPRSPRHTSPPAQGALF